MIDATELRIGNLVQSRDRDNDGSIVRVESIDDTGINYFISNAGYEHAYFYEPTKDKDWFWIEPIPLTTEILEKCEFEYGVSKGIASLEDERNNKEEDTYYWDLRVPRNDYTDGFTFSIVKWGIKDDFNFSNQWLRVKLKSLHQLQNLYYALTQKELEIKL